MRLKTIFLFIFALSASIVSFSQTNGRILVTSMGLDAEYRVTLCGRVLRNVPNERQTALTSGEAVINALKGDPIRLWVHFSHGSAKRLYGNSARIDKSYLNSGLTTVSSSSKYDDKSCRSLDDLKREIESFKNIEFVEGAVIYLGSCWIGTPDDRNGGVVFAQKLADITGATVIAGRERTEPLRETNQTLTYTNNANFFKFRPNLPPEELGRSFDLSDLLRKYQKNNQLNTARR